MSDFVLVTEFTPDGDQPKAIQALTEGLNENLPHQVLLGVTGSGKTFTIANVIAAVNRPALVIAPNKILAAQLHNELKELFPNNAVEYFVSYYDYYQPEAYMPTTDTYIEKETNVNDELDKMRHAATRALLTRRDCIIVASVSCIYGIGSPETYRQLCVELVKGDTFPRDDLVAGLVAMQYERNDIDFHRGTFRVRGDVVDIFPAYEGDRSIRVEYFGDEIESIAEMDPLRGITHRTFPHTAIFPSSHYATTADNLKRAIEGIKIELEDRLKELRAENQELFAQRLEQRTRYDIEMLRELGYCSGIENYSRHLDGRLPGEAPHTLFSYLPEDGLLIIDESHITVPQIGAMYKGDRSRKSKLVEFGFRLPCACDNRPLKFEEFQARAPQTIYVSATPASYELEASEGLIVEQVVRPTGLIDPIVEIKPASNQVDDLLDEIRNTVAKNERVMVTVLTKRMAEDLTDYYRDLNIRVRYMHADVETLERIELIRDLRKGEYDVLIGINLLREGLDIPELSLMAILDADKEGYLRSETSLIQTCGRAARNINGRVIMYADTVTGSMERALGEMNRRREAQLAYNKANGITPRSIQRAISESSRSIHERDYVTVSIAAEDQDMYVTTQDLRKTIRTLRNNMKKAADKMDFEKAAELRDRIRTLEKRELEEVL